MISDSEAIKNSYNRRKEASECKGPSSSREEEFCDENVFIDDDSEASSPPAVKKRKRNWCQPQPLVRKPASARRRTEGAIKNREDQDAGGLIREAEGRDVDGAGLSYADVEGKADKIIMGPMDVAKVISIAGDCPFAASWCVTAPQDAKGDVLATVTYRPDCYLRTFKGYFRDSKANGKGTLIYRDGTEVSGWFNSGTIVVNAEEFDGFKKCAREVQNLVCRHVGGGLPLLAYKEKMLKYRERLEDINYLLEKMLQL